MSDQIGAVPIPTIAVSSTPWPISLPIEFGFINLTQPRVVVHQFGAGNAKREQRFYLGPNPRRWTLNFELSETQRDDLRNFWEVMNGPVTPFTIVLPKDNAGTTESVTVHFAAEPLVTDFGIGDVSKVTINLEEIYTGSGPTYPVNTTLQRFPDSTLATALTSQTQSLIPLVHIRPTAYQPGNPLDNIYLSDRRCTVGNQLYLPRLLAWDGISQTAVGVPGSSGSSDTVTFTFGNADRVMRKLADSVLLTAARVEFSVYHVQSGILLQLWAGQVLPGGFQFGVGPTFTLQCGDIISSPFCILPQKLIDRSCWIAYNNGLDCPFSTASTGMDFAHFPNADANDCDRGYDSDNGCLAHGMSPYYGGVIAVPQGIRIADNSTGFFGIGRNTISSVSLVSDSVYGQPIPIVFTDIEMPVKCLTVAGRNEGSGNGSFYEALGIVSQGPIGAFGDKSTLDGSLRHGYPIPPGPGLISGERRILGTFPANTGSDTNTGDWFSLDENGDQTFTNNVFGLGAVPVYPPWRKVHQGNSTYLTNLVANVAFLVLRRVGTSSDLLTTPDQHDLEADVVAGFQGYIWLDNGQRLSNTTTITNPIWAALNCYFLALGIFNAPAAIQEQWFDVPAAILAASICDINVPRIVETSEGGGFSTQFKFIGRIADQRPFRDWLTDILSNCNGIFSFAFGRLRLSIRYNANDVAAYDDFNMIFRSLNLAGYQSQITRLSASFADPEYFWVPNTAVYQDDDFALQFGGGISGGIQPRHLTGQINLAGTADIDQATRIVITRGREEIGGVNLTSSGGTNEPALARRVTLKTTVLGLDTEPGAVISVTHAECPGGTFSSPTTIKVRVESWKLLPDWSIELTGRTVTPSMYQFDVGPLVAGVPPPVGIGEVFPFPYQTIWLPNVEPPMPGNALFDQADLSFTTEQDYETLKDGSIRAALLITAQLPVDNFEPSTVSPIIDSISTLPTGGSLPGGHSYWVQVACETAGKTSSPGSNIVAVHVPSGTDTNLIVLDGLVWPAPPTAGTNAGPWANRLTFVATDDVRLLSKYDDQSTDLPITFNILGPLTPRSYNPPSPAYLSGRIKVKHGVHFGVIGEQVDSVDSSSITVLALAGLPPGPDGLDDWSHRVVSIIAKESGSNPRMDFTCTAYDPAAGKFTVTPDPSVAGVALGDVLVVRISSPFVTHNTYQDVKFINQRYPFGMLGLDPVTGLYTVANLEVGNRLRVSAGTGAFQTPRAVIANDKDTYTLDADWEVLPDATSIILVESSAWSYLSDVTAAHSGQFGVPAVNRVIVDNLIMQPVLVGLFMVDIQQGETPEKYAVVRETYLYGKLGPFGQPGATFVFGRGTDGGAAQVQAGDNTNLVPVKQGGTLVGWDAIGEDAPIGDAIFDLVLYDDKGVVIGSLFTPSGPHVKIPSGSKSLELGTVFGGQAVVTAGQSVKGICTTPGTALSLQSVTIKLYWQ